MLLHDFVESSSIDLWQGRKYAYLSGFVMMMWLLKTFF